MSAVVTRTIRARIVPVRVPESRFRSLVDACRAALLEAIRRQARREQGAWVPYITLREWIAGEGFERIIHPAWVELLTLVGPKPAAFIFQELVRKVLAECVPTLKCDACRRTCYVFNATVDRDEIALCPTCAAIETETLIRPQDIEHLTRPKPVTEYDLQQVDETCQLFEQEAA